MHFFPDGRPQRLSEWHVVFRDGDRLALNRGVVPFDLNSALFSDYAHKLRTVWMPPGTAARYSDLQTFDFPVGTVISKTFYYPHAGAAASAVARTYDQSRDFTGSGLNLGNVRLIETRLLVRREHGWVALPYVWNAEQTDAELARTGDEVALELVASDGARERFTYVVPNENQCAGCHVTNLKTRAIAPIGPKARHLNRDYPYPEGAQNQLTYLEKIGYLTGLPPPPVQLPRSAAWRDATQPLEARARAYLEINCGHCHNPSGPADTTGLTFDAGTPADRHLGLCKPPVAAGRGTGDHLYDIVPGHPDDSILPFRMASREPGVMMPEQGRGTVHREGLELISEWIAAMPGSCSS